jgi:hypothetical protein
VPDTRDYTPYPELSADEKFVLDRLSATAFKVWEILAASTNVPVCRKCLNARLRSDGVQADQLAAQVRELRNAGFQIPKGLRTRCAEHGSQTADNLVAVAPQAGSSKLRWAYSLAERDKMKRACGNRDAFTGATGELELDHRIPMLRVDGDEERVDPDDRTTVQAAFMCLSRTNNLLKSRKCEACANTGKRPPSISGVVFWYQGGEEYETTTGCRGCFWAYPEEWARKLNETLSELSSGRDRV